MVICATKFELLSFGHDTIFKDSIMILSNGLDALVMRRVPDKMCRVVCGIAAPTRQGYHSWRVNPATGVAPRVDKSVYETACIC